MEFTRLLVVGACLLFLQSAVYARSVEEMVIGDDESSNSLAEKMIEENPMEQNAAGLSQYDLAPTTDDVNDELVMEDNDIGRWWGNKKIAFSAYLSSNRMLRKGQHIKFDQVLLNDGNGYEAATGIFRAPVSGVYSFTFVIAQRHHYEIRTNLFVDGKVVVGAIAEGIKKHHDTQETNTVNVHVRKGKPVWVESYSSRGRLEGSKDNFRYTSFSGHILYERK